jgi:hypothetical protein
MMNWKGLKGNYDGYFGAKIKTSFLQRPNKT